MSISREREREHAQKKMFVYMCRAYVYSIHLDYVCIYIYKRRLHGIKPKNHKIPHNSVHTYTRKQE